VVFRPNTHLSSIIRQDDKNFPFRLQFVSRSFELLSVVSVRMSQQHIQTPFSVRQVKRFPFQTQIWEDSCNYSDNVAFPPNAILDKASRVEDVQLSGRQSPLSGHSNLIMELRAAEVQPFGR
jgi:hypothetical protein